MLRGHDSAILSRPLGRWEVWVVDVPTLYALEVRVMRWECGSPRGFNSRSQVAVVVEESTNVGIECHKPPIFDGLYHP